jgi:hypothetical protein
VFIISDALAIVRVINYAPRVKLQVVASLIVTYFCNMFIAQAASVSFNLVCEPGWSLPQKKVLAPGLALKYETRIEVTKECNSVNYDCKNPYSISSYAQ